ncbi:MAG: Ig-like domain-containing protein [Gemmatimonadota bacterium]|nr:Ig-like domain-containing protein [Gemmatimonadota bacterium]
MSGSTSLFRLGPLALTVAAATAPAAPPLSAQTDDDPVVKLVAEPAELTMRVGDEVEVRVTGVTRSGAQVDSPSVRLVGPRSAVRVRQGVVTALAAGEYALIATLVQGGGPPAGETVMVRVPVRIDWPPVARVVVTPLTDHRLMVGTTIRLGVRAEHEDGSERPGPEIEWLSMSPDLATVDRFGRVTGVAPGRAAIRATVDGVAGTEHFDVSAFTGTTLTITGGVARARTGDVIDFGAEVRDQSGRLLSRVPVEWSHAYEAPPGTIAPPAPAQMRGGRFVADLPGLHTVVAHAGPLAARTTVEVVPRDVVQQLEIHGHGREQRVRTTDFWVFEGVDGRDYAVTGAKRSDGYGFVWDVTDPANIFKTDSIQVDARSVNDMKVSPDGRYATMTREGASDRRNGVVILDLADPAHPVIAAEVTDHGLTGGVHNAFPTNDHVFALAGGDKYVILDVSDIYSPRYVGEYNHPDSRLHDVWVMDGLAYSAEWENGLVVVDVGNGRWGGSPENPVFVSSYPLPTGGTHAVFPYISESTGKHYVFVGDEIMSRRGLAWEGPGRGRGSYQLPYDPETGMHGIPLATQGYIQIIDFSDPEAPEMVARYEVPEYGTHNIWVEDDILYQAYYEGGVRLVDVSGELMGNLYTQGREIAVFKAFDPAGYVPNSPMAWSVMPFKGRIFFSDTNSGLWSARLVPRSRPIS